MFLKQAHYSSYLFFHILSSPGLFSLLFSPRIFAIRGTVNGKTRSVIRDEYFRPSRQIFPDSARSKIYSIEHTSYRSDEASTLARSSHSAASSEPVRRNSGNREISQLSHSYSPSRRETSPSIGFNDLERREILRFRLRQRVLAKINAKAV